MTGYTGFWPEHEEMQEWYYMPVQLSFPEGINLADIKIITGEGDNQKIFDAEALEADKTFIQIVRIANDKTSMKYVVDLDGEGSKYNPVTIPST